MGRARGGDVRPVDGNQSCFYHDQPITLRLVAIISSCGGNMRSSRPIFIGGLMKSGTSLLRAMLGQHPAIASGLETYWFDLDWSGPRDAKFQQHVSRLSEFFKIPQSEMDDIVTRSSTNYEFLDRLMTKFTLAQGKSRWIEKTPGNIAHLDLIYDGWPDAQFIHVIREPLDILASFKEAKRYDWVEAFPELWSNYLGRGAALARSLSLGPTQLMELRYEKLILEPEQTMRDVLAFLDVDWAPETSRYSGQSQDYDTVLAVTGKASTTLRRLSTPLTDERLGIRNALISSSEAEFIRASIVEKGFGPLYDQIRQQTDSL